MLPFSPFFFICLPIKFLFNIHAFQKKCHLFFFSLNVFFFFFPTVQNQMHLCGLTQFAVREQVNVWYMNRMKLGLLLEHEHKLKEEHAASEEACNVKLLSPPHSETTPALGQQHSLLYSCPDWISAAAENTGCFYSSTSRLQMTMCPKYCTVGSKVLCITDSALNRRFRVLTFLMLLRL